MLLKFIALIKLKRKKEMKHKCYIFYIFVECFRLIVTLVYIPAGLALRNDRGFTSERILFPKPPDSAYADKKVFLEYYEQTVQKICTDHNLSSSQCFAVLRFLMVTYPFGDTKQLTRFYHQSTAAGALNDKKVYLYPTLNITNFEYKDTLKNSEVEQGFAAIPILFSPLTCFSKTLLKPDPRTTTLTVDLQYFLTRKYYNAPVRRVLYGRIQQKCKKYGFNEQHCNVFKTKIEDFARDEQMDVPRNKTIKVTLHNDVSVGERISLSPEDNPIRKIANLCGKYIF